MKLLSVLMLLLLLSCQSGAEKPDNLIGDEVMVDIFYDLALIDGMRSHNPMALETYDITPHEYIYKKYKIDSLQFAHSNRYYAADIEKYKRMYEQVSTRIEQNKAEIDSLLKKENPGLEVPKELDDKPRGFIK